jgi:hypothetical protein
LPAEAQSLEDLVRRLIQAIRTDPPSFDQPATPDGAQRMAAVAGLLRATRLLEDALACANNEADEALLLVLRTLVEININVRYLLANGRDGLKQLVANQERRRLAIANALFGPDDPRSQELKANIDKAELPPERQIAVLATDSPQGRLAYDGLYRWLSNSSVHGGTQSWEPYWFQPESTDLGIGRCVARGLTGSVGRCCRLDWPVGRPAGLDGSHGCCLAAAPSSRAGCRRAGWPLTTIRRRTYGPLRRCMGGSAAGPGPARTRAPMASRPADAA